MRPLLVVLGLLILAAPAVAARDPGYEAVLEAYKAKRWEDVVRLAPAFLEEKPDYVHADAARYMHARALDSLRRFEEAVAVYRTVRGKRAVKCAFLAGVALFRGREFGMAAVALRSFIEAHPDSKDVRSARDYLFRCDTGFTDVRDGFVREYAGKYETDPRLAAVRRTLAHKRREALRRIETTLGRRVSPSFLIRLADAGADRSGHFARTRIEVVKDEPRHVVVLYTEPLVLGTVDLDRTLTHELYHCVQRDALGEDHFRTPKWVREGAALYVAGQGESRTRMLAAEVGRRRKLADPMARLVNGLGGDHAFEDYAESVAAFEAAERRHGKAKAIRLLGRLLETTDVAAAVRETLGEDLATFERGAAELARSRLGPLVTGGRDALMRAIALGGKKDWAGMLAALPEPPGVYAPVVAYYRALALFESGRHEDALAAVREGYLARHRRFPPLTDNALLVELKILAALDSDEFAAAADRAARDLEPTGAYPALKSFLAKLAGERNAGDDGGG